MINEAVHHYQTSAYFKLDEIFRYSMFHSEDLNIRLDLKIWRRYRNASFTTM